MKLDNLILVLEEVKRDHGGDIECLIEVNIDDAVCLKPVEEVSFEDRKEYGESITFLI